MLQQLDAPSQASWVAVIASDDEMPRNSRTAASRREDTHAEALAYEIVRYMPELAEQLMSNGRKRLVSA